MFNLVKMDIYRMIRSKSFAVGLIMSAVVSVVSILFGWGMVEIFKFALQTDEMAAANMIALPLPMFGWIDGVDFAESVLFGVNALSLFVGCMVTASFIGAEQSCGYTKNIAGQLNNRGYTVISKFIAAAFSQTVILLVYTVVSALATFAFLGKYIDAYSIVPLLGCLGLKLLLYFAVNAVIVFLCTLTKSHALAMVTGAVLGSGVTYIIYLIANSILSMVKIRVNIAHFMPDGVNGMINISSFSDEAGRALAVSIVFIVVFMTAAAVLYRKRDVK